MDIFPRGVFFCPKKVEVDSVLRLQTESETVNGCVSRVFTVSGSVCNRDPCSRAYRSVKH